MKLPCSLFYKINVIKFIVEINFYLIKVFILINIIYKINLDFITATIFLDLIIL